MVHLRILHAALRESTLLELPIEMIAAIFKDMKESNVVVRILKIVKDLTPQRHINYVSQAVEIRRGADDHTARPQNFPETLHCNVTRYRQMLDDFGEEYAVEFAFERGFGFAQVPVDPFHSLGRHVCHMWARKVRYNAMVVPQFGTQKSQLSSAYLQDLHRMSWS